jgi:3-dehydroquinate dehydratase
VQLVVTIFEKTFDAALAAVRQLPEACDIVEVRVDAFGGATDYGAFRNATAKPLLFTNRGGEPVDPGFGLIDVEYGRAIEHPERTVLSLHDFEGVPDLEKLIPAMLAEKCAHTKIAVTPKTLRENESIVRYLQPGLTLFGMGERGLYSRVLAPFFGSELIFVSVDDAHAAAPGQLSLDRALAIYGERPLPRVTDVFAIVGNPAGQSLSPPIHNALFRKHGVPAAYTIASIESFDEIFDSTLTGMSVTAPFKDDAFLYARRIEAKIGTNAAEARAVNTIVRTRSQVIADNTDVDGFETLLRDVKGKRAAVIGAGGTARAARVALERAGFEVKMFNRTERERARPLAELKRFDGDVLIDTLPASVRVERPDVPVLIEAAYGPGRGESGLRLLQAQAVRQNALFRKAFE